MSVHARFVTFEGYGANVFDGITSHTYLIEMIPGPLSGQLNVALYANVAGSGSPSFVLDGSEVRDESSYQSFSWCEVEGCWPNRTFDSCSHAGSQLNRHEVALGEGSLTLELRIQRFSPLISAGTEAGAFVRASGTFRHDFDQRDYWKLVYNPEHHHFSRHFAVLFDAPIEGACGLEISGLDPYYSKAEQGGPPPGEAYTIDCALDHLEPLGLEAHTLTTDP